MRWIVYLLGSLYFTRVRISNGMSSPLQNTRLAFTNLRFLWRWYDMRLLIEGLVYTAEVKSVLLYSSKTWSLRNKICGDFQRQNTVIFVVLVEYSKLEIILNVVDPRV